MQSECRNRLRRQKQRRLFHRPATAKQRVSELEVLLCKIYEDNILGKLSDSRYATLDAQYEKEQSELTAEISALEKAVKSYEKHEKDADRFIALIDKYENFDKLTIAMLNEFIEKILVHERDRKGSIQTTLTALNGMTADEVKKVVIAYEPVWAIGTGLTATDEQANETIGVIRAAIARKYGKRVADKVRIQYGGSMNPKNASGLMAQPEIDGGLIGGASLKAEDFSKVVNF